MVWAVGAHQPRDHHRDVQHRQNGFDHGHRPDLGRSGRHAGRAGRRHASKAEIEKIETGGKRMQITRRIQIEGMRLDDGKDGVELGEEESDEEIDADRAEDRLRLDRKSTRLNSSHQHRSRMPSSA